MKNLKQVQLLPVLLFANLQSFAQDMRTVNQNSSRSNHIRSGINSNSWAFGINSGASFGVGSNENTLFRGNSMATKMSGRYNLGKIGLELSSGIIPGAISDNSLNKFIADRKFPRDQIQLTTGKPFNTYLMFGPSIRFGSHVEVSAEMQGGIFLNNPGSVTIGQLGATRPLYRFDASGKNLFPGFSGNINIAYPLNKTTNFFINTDYLQSRSSIRLLDPQRGIDVPIEQNRNVKLFTTGVGIVKSFGNSNTRVLPTVNKREIAIDESGVHIVIQRDQATGQASGKRVLPTVNKREITIDEPGVQIIIQRDQATGQASGKRLLPTVNKREIISPRNMASGLPTGRTYRPGRPVYGNRTTESCGPVTTKTTNADGSIEEMTFACPDDAAMYSRQTPKRDFGDKLNDPNQQDNLKKTFVSPHVFEQKGIVSGRVSRASSPSTGVVTNSSMKRNGVATGAGAAAGAKGISTNIYARESSTGKATGKRTREPSTGVASGKRQYEPVFIEGQTDVCNPCLAIVTNNTTRSGSINMNSQNSNTRQTNQSSFGTMVRSNTDDDCDGVAGLDVSLIDINSDRIVAITKTESCGGFWFANVPVGSYVVRINGNINSKKEYDVNLKGEGKYDVAGELLAAIDQWEVFINTGNSSGNNKTAINNSHSNIKNLIFIEADTDGDGEFESLRTNASFNDGSSLDITPQAIVNTSRSNIKQITMPIGNSSSNNNQKATINTTRSNIKHISISVGDLDGDGISKVIATGVFIDGSSKDITNDLQINTSHSNIRQYAISLADLDGDGAADAIIKTKTKSNQSNDRVATGDVNGDGVDIAINNSHSNIKNLRVASGDVDDDGKAELLVGGFIPGGSIISAAKMPGDPIPGLDVKLGKNPGGQSLQTTTADAEGEFQFTALEAGDYFITVEQNIIIDDETIVTVSGDAEKNSNTSEANLVADKKVVVRGWDPTNKENTKNINTSEANLKDVAIRNRDVKGSSSQNSQTLRSILIEADLDGDGEYETDVTNLLNDEITIDESGEIIAPQMKAGISTSRSNIRTRSSLQAKGDGVYVSYGKATVNSKEVNVKTVLKTKHDTVKNSINNVR